MEKRLTVDVSKDTYRDLLKIQLEQSLANKKKVPLGELIRVAVDKWLYETKIPAQK